VLRRLLEACKTFIYFLAADWYSMQQHHLSALSWYEISKGWNSAINDRAFGLRSFDSALKVCQQARREEKEILSERWE
jgi:hypothetical protein